MGSGKTSTGKELSKILGFHFWEMDQWIEEKNKKKIPEIFDNYGEEYFRSQEREAIKYLELKSQYVVSTGGGAWIDETNRKNLLKMGWCVWLKVSAKDAWSRIGNHLEQRPLLSKTNDPFQYMQLLMRKREPLYSLAPINFDTTGKNPREVAFGIAKVFKEVKPFDLLEL